MDLDVGDELASLGDVVRDRPETGQATNGAGQTTQAGQAIDGAQSDDAQAHATADTRAPIVFQSPVVAKPDEAPRREDALALSRGSSRTTRRRVLPWVWRRGWILVVTLLAGAFGGRWASSHHLPSYSAKATLVVQSGASALGPGDANDASALAITYATFIPKDSALLKTSAHFLGVPSSTMSSRISTSAETGTSVIQLSYSAPTPSGAVRGATVVSRTIANSPLVSGSIPQGSVKVVTLPTAASSGSSLTRYALPIGALLGLSVGLIAVLAAERADPRLDDETEVAESTGCPATLVPGEIGLTELARAISLSPRMGRSVTFIPLTADETGAATMLADHLQAAWPSDMPLAQLRLGAAVDSGAMDLAHSVEPTVLVVGTGRPRRQVQSAVARLQLIGRAPIWAVLVQRSRRRHLRAR